MRRRRSSVLPSTEAVYRQLLTPLKPPHTNRETAPLWDGFIHFLEIKPELCLKRMQKGQQPLEMLYRHPAAVVQLSIGRARGQ